MGSHLVVDCAAGSTHRVVETDDGFRIVATNEATAPTEEDLRRVQEAAAAFERYFPGLRLR